ncbi:MAG: class I SAM-dependent methyltransferase [Candidatus Omnitrophica bacterium]|nr:class I SAM-dependent methyltransferase [Candidatus Omnitrophota bacterium]MDD5487910.1 class I SAM-dependent methyltransferase [Candidatus Omnitrophota bacterium]
MDRVREHFESEAGQFDDIILKRVPMYAEMIDTLVSALPFGDANGLRILDIGCGTGNITRVVKERFPEASVTCMDLAENMIAAAKKKLAKLNGIEFKRCDITEFEFREPYDAIISSLTLHHIRDGKVKRSLYKKFRENLKPGGVFYNADVVLWSTKHLASLYMDKWGAFMEKYLTIEEVRDTFDKHHAEDHPFRIMEELEWLKDAGFRDIEVLWRNYNGAVYGGVK